MKKQIIYLRHHQVKPIYAKCKETIEHVFATEGTRLLREKGLGETRR